MTPALGNPIVQVIIALIVFGLFIAAMRWLWTREMLKRHERGEDMDEDDEAQFKI